MGGRLKYEREKASARQRKRTRKEELKGKAKIELMIDGIIATNSSSGESGRARELKNIKDILNSP
jgi:hypothetical protein